MTYLYGHQSAENETLQRALAALNLYRGKIDGKHLGKTRDAVIEAQLLYGIDPHDGIVRADLLLELGITAPKAVKPNIITQWLTSFATKKAVEYLKGLPQMEFLSGFKTYILAGLILLSSAAETFIPGLDIPGFSMSIGEAVMVSLALITGRGGAKADVKKALGG